MGVRRRYRTTKDQTTLRDAVLGSVSYKENRRRGDFGVLFRLTQSSGSRTESGHVLVEEESRKVRLGTPLVPSVTAEGDGTERSHSPRVGRSPDLGHHGSSVGGHCL